MNEAHLMCLAALTLGASACAHASTFDARIADLSAIARQAREHGAYRCAPEELARAEAELEFARTERGLGDPARAEEHLVQAGANARAALRLSAEPNCASAREASPRARNLPSLARERTARFDHPSRAERLSMTQPPLRRGSTKEHAAN